MQSLANAQQLAKVRGHNFDDVELICTGKSMKWISISKTEIANHFVFVEAPPEASNIDVENLCSNTWLSDSKKAICTSAHFEFIQSVSYIAELLRLEQQPYTAYPYQKALSRGPPINS